MRKEQSILKIDVEEDIFEYDIVFPSNSFKDSDKHLSEIEKRICENNKIINEINDEIDNLTNHADKFDYMIAVSSGVICGVIDSFFIGEWNFIDAKVSSDIIINNKVLSYARKCGYKGDGLKEAISFLERKFPLAGDSTWKGSGNGISEREHHLDDFSHHPTFVGLIFCIVSQFTKTAMYSNSEGEFVKLPITIDENGNLEGKTPAAKISAGILNWLINVARNRKGHLFSDMAGSKHTPGGGMGIPGPIVSLLKELSALPMINDSGLAKNIAKAYKKGIGAEKGQLDLGCLNALFEGASSKMDLRTENAVTSELKRQALPVVINELIVRTFYFVRNLISEIKVKKSLMNIDWKKVMPFKNRTIIRMLTIATGTFTAIDLADAAIRSAIKSGGEPMTFLKNFVLRMNFVGVGRFAIAIGQDTLMGYKNEYYRKKRIKVMIEQIFLLEAKAYFKQSDMWISAINTDKAIVDTWSIMEESIVFYQESMIEISDSMKGIEKVLSAANKKNPEQMKQMVDILKFN